MQIDIVIVSCSCFAPTPSMAAMITNHFKLRRDVLTYNLSGMGCSSSLICIDLVKHLLKVRPAPRILQCLSSVPVGSTSRVLLGAVSDPVRTVPVSESRSWIIVGWTLDGCT